MIKVYGASDDLIEVDGDVNKEFNVYNTLNNLVFDDGTVLSVIYGCKGVWKIELVEHGTATFTKVYEADEHSEDKGEGYTDIVTLEGAITSVGLGVAK